MNMRQIGWGLLLFGLPFSNFIFKPGLDLWHSQALWAQGGTLILFGLSFMQHPQREVKNPPLGAWIIWISILALYGFTVTTTTHKVYPFAMLPSLLHMAIIVMFYQAAVKSLDSMSLKFALKAAAYASVVMMVYCVLQALNLDQFFNDLSGSKTINIVGTVGNQSHLGAYMALMIPIFLIQEKKRWLLAAGAAFGICIISNSAGALAALGAGALFWTHYMLKSKRWLVYTAAFVAAILIIIFARDFISFNGRIEAWGEFKKFFAMKPITGLGTGFIFEASKNPQIEILRGWRHVHNEFFQVAIEQGLIGLGIIIWAVCSVFKKFFATPKTKISVCLATMLVILGVNSLVNFPAHLWIIGSLGLMAYSGLYILAREAGA